MRSTTHEVPRRTFLKQCAAAAVAPAALGAAVGASGAPPFRFAAIGLNHSHINSLISTMLRAGGQLVSVYAREPDLLAAFQQRFPQAKAARSEAEILEDSSIALVASAAIPDERGPLGVRVMQHGKDYLVDKPGLTTIEQLNEARRVQAQTRRIYSVLFGRFENRATVRAGELIQAGAIGRVIQTTGLGPHRMSPSSRPAWFFEKPRYGGILVDLASHQADHFLFFTGSSSAQVVASQVGNIRHPQYPGLEDFGDVAFRGNRGVGYARVDWFTPDGLSTYGDERLTILGTDGYIELRQTVDIAGRAGANGHLFLVDQKSARYIDCSDVQLNFGPQLAADIANRTETAMPQAHCFLATELTLEAERRAQRVELG